MHFFNSLAFFIIISCFGIIFSNSLTITLQPSSESPPEITVDFQPKTNISYVNILNETLVVVSQSTSYVLLQCFASYPVMWSLSSLENPWVSTGTEAVRQVGNFADKSTYKYAMTIVLRNSAINSSQLPEIFTCLRADDDTSNRLSSRMVVVWESGTSPYWNDVRNDYVDEEYQIYWKEKTNLLETNWIHIPCYSLNVNSTKVELYKHANYQDGDDVTGELILQTIDDSSQNMLRFEPYMGFYINAISIHNDIEIYECHAKEIEKREKRSSDYNYDGTIHDYGKRKISLRASNQYNYSLFGDDDYIYVESAEDSLFDNSTSTESPNNNASRATRSLDTIIFKLVKLNDTTQLIDMKPPSTTKTGHAVDILSSYLNRQGPNMSLSRSSTGTNCCLTSGNQGRSSDNLVLYYKSCNEPLMCLTKNHILRKTFLFYHYKDDSVVNGSCRYISNSAVMPYTLASPNVFICHMRTDKKIARQEFSGYYEINENNSENSYLLQERNGTAYTAIDFYAPNETMYSSIWQKVVGLANIKFYVDDTIRVRCQSSPFFYALGTVWEKEWKNGTKEFVLEEGNSTHPPSALFSSSVLGVKIQDGLTKLTCYIPPWNSTDWVTHSLSFSTKVSSKPVSPVGESVVYENVTFYTQEKMTLDCGFDGNPSPNFKWTLINSGSGCSFSGNCYSLGGSRNDSSSTDVFRGQSLRRRINGNIYQGVTINMPVGEVVYVRSSYYDPYGSTFSSITTSSTLVSFRNYLSSNTTIPSGQASCTATNVAGNATKYFNLQALRSEAPRIKHSARETVVLFLDDEKSFLNCSVTQGAPVPTFSWRKHEMSIDNFSNYEAESSGNYSTLTFKKVEYEDEGDYICNADNFVSGATKIFSVRVRERPHSRVWAEITVAFLSLALIVSFGLLAYIYISKTKKISNLQTRVEYSTRSNLHDSRITLATNLD